MEGNVLFVWTLVRPLFVICSYHVRSMLVPRSYHVRQTLESNGHLRLPIPADSAMILAYCQYMRSFIVRTAAGGMVSLWFVMKTGLWL